MRKINVSGPGGASGLHLKDMPDKKKNTVSVRNPKGSEQIRKYYI